MQKTNILSANECQMFAGHFFGGGAWSVAMGGYGEQNDRS